MTEPKKRSADAAATAALFAVILILSIVLAALTDLPVVARGAIAVVSGIVAAVVVFSLVSRRTRA